MPSARPYQPARGRSGVAADAVHRVVVMVGDGGHEPESRGKCSVYLRFAREEEDCAVLGGPEDRRDEPVEAALEGARDRASPR